MLNVQNLTFQYSDEPAPTIQDLSFHVRPGQFVSVIGASGCGKSTLFKLFTRILSPDSGQIMIDGHNITSAQSMVGYMPQKDMLMPWRSIEKNLSLPLELRKIPKAQMGAKIDKILEDVGLTDYKYKSPGDLSGGMRQRIAFARTLLTEADLLLLDEPFSALDSMTKMSMQEWLLNQWHKTDKTVVFITHDVEEAIFLSDTIYVIQEKPVQTMDLITVPLAYPRTRESLTERPILELKNQLINALRKQVVI